MSFTGIGAVDRTERSRRRGREELRGWRDRVFQGPLMQETRTRTYICRTTKRRRAVILLVGCLLGEGGIWSLGAQSVQASVVSSQVDHSQESVLAFQFQSRDEADANIQVYDDIVAQQIDHIDVGAPSGASSANGDIEAPRSIDEEADILIVGPLKKGAEAIHSASGSNMDSLLMAHLSGAVKPGAVRIGCGVTGSPDIESLAFRNPYGSLVVLAVNHSKSAVSLEVFWKDRLFTYTQAGSSIALYAWDPEIQLVSLIARSARLLPKGSLSIEARCSNASPMGIDLRCESEAFSCSVFPVRFVCSSQQDSVTLSVAVWSADKSEGDGVKPGFVTITAAPDVGEPTSLHLACCGAGR